MSSFQSRRRQLLLASLAGAASQPAAAMPSSIDTGAGLEAPFWAQLTGTWSGELSYLDGALQPIIQTYHSVAEFTLSDGQLSHTEYKFYPAGTELARTLGGIDLPMDQGIEMITNSVGPISHDRWAPGPNDVFQLVDRNTIIRHLRDADTGVPRYATYWTLTSPRTLLITNLGILSTRDEADYYNRPLEPRRPNTRLGELKGCSVFRYIKLAGGRREPERQRLTEMHNVTRSIDRRLSAD